MATGADVASIPALREWLTAMGIYRHEAMQTLEGIQIEIRRGIDWVSEQCALWQRAVKSCEEEVVQRKAELAARKFPGFDGRMPDTTVQEMNLRRAMARLEYAEDKVKKCKAWMSKLPKSVEETYSGPSNRLAVFIDTDLPRGLNGLDRRLDALERYAELRTDYASGPSLSPPPPPAEGKS